MNWRHYVKAIIMALGATISALSAAIAGDNLINTSEWLNAAILGLGAFPVWYVFNSRTAPYAKAVVAGMVAAITLAVSAHVGGITGVEWIQLAVAFLTGAGVLTLPNGPSAGGQIPPPPERSTPLSQL